MSVMNSPMLTKADLAYGFEVDERTISRWQDRDENPLPVAERNRTKAGNRYDLRAVLQWLRRETLSEAGVAADGAVYDYEAERARLTKAQADKTELEVRELRAELVRLPVVELHWQGMVAAMRAKLLALPSRVAAQVADPERLQQTQDQVQTLIYEALGDIAGDAFPEPIRSRAAAERDRTHAPDSPPAAAADDQPVGGGKLAAERRGQRRTR